VTWSGQVEKGGTLSELGFGKGNDHAERARAGSIARNRIADVRNADEPADERDDLRTSWHKRRY
jgi:hypothetical protein